jgi:DNA-binding HxlR family transcriptional regulator
MKKQENPPRVTDCKKSVEAVRDALYVMGGKWKIPVLLALSEGPKRFTELQRTIEQITSRVLSKELKELELNEFVRRTVYDSSPVIVEYELTPYSRTLDSLIIALRDWGLQHREHILNGCKQKRQQLLLAKK